MLNTAQHYDVSVLLVTYRPRPEALRMVLRSILSQREVKIQLVVTDDGSEENCFPQIKAILEGQGFADYKLLAHEHNQGTVKNAYDGFLACDAAYIKGLTPDDYFCDAYVLRDWLKHMEEKKPAVSFSQVVCYTSRDGTCQTVAAPARPQYPEEWEKGNLFSSYVLWGDNGYGVATMYDRDKTLPYLQMILNKAIYAEDTVCRLMAACGERLSYFDRNAVLYEYGSGISTQASSQWQQRIVADYAAVDRLILERLEPGRRKRQFALVADAEQEKNRFCQRLKRLRCALVIPGYFWNTRKAKYRPKMTGALDAMPILEELGKE